MELTETPESFLRGAFRLWHPEVSLGEIQNQAYGYLFPQGPFFLLAHQAGVASWVTQRIWTALVLVVAAEGARRVARRVGLGGGGSLVAGLAFALCPRLIGIAGVVSAETLPAAVLPWALLPVLRAIDGSRRPRHAALLSAIAVAAMGGVNAVVVIGALPLIPIFIGWAAVKGLVRWSLLGWWTGFVFLATSWWLVPLFFLGSYSPPFYRYVESASVTTGAVGWFQAASGTSHWLSYLQLNGKPWWPAAHDFVSVSGLVILAALLAALELSGLVMLRHRSRTPLVLGAALAFVVLTIAHGTWVGSPFANQVEHMLDGPLAAFRNISKIEPTLRLPLVIGLGNLAETAARSWHPPRALPTATPLVAVVSLVLVMLQPYYAGDGRIAGWTRIPHYWSAAASYLSTHGDGLATLVVPGSGFAVQSWGRTLQEPLTAFPDVRWVARTQVPLVPGQSIRALEGLESVIDSGTSSPKLAQTLAQMGIGQVLLRRDLDKSQTDAPDPRYAARTLDESPGIERIGSYGPLTIYEVTPRRSAARLALASAVQTVQGGPEDVVRLSAAGLLGDQPAVLSGELNWTARVSTLTDGYQDRERNFGRIYQGIGPLLTKSDPVAVKRAATDYPGAPGAQQVHAQYEGVASITASSSRGFVDSLGPLIPQFGPYSAFDGVTLTRWESAPFEAPNGQWVQANFTGRRTVGRVVVHLSHDFSVLPVRRITVSAGGEQGTAPVDARTGVAVVNLGGVRANSLRVTIARVSDPTRYVSVGIDDVTLSGLIVRRTLAVPPRATTAAPTIVFATAPEQRACRPFDVPSACAAERVRGAEEPRGIDRRFTLTDGSAYTVAGQVVARSSLEAGRLLDPLGYSQAVTASSVLGDDPALSPRSAYDGDLRTSWISEAGDNDPSLSIRWKRRQTITSVHVDATLTNGVAPKTVSLISPNGFRKVTLRDGYAAVPSLRTKEVQVVFEGVSGRRSLRVAELSLGGTTDLDRPFDGAARTGAVCGFGPSVVVNGTVVRTAVQGTLDDIRNGNPLTLIGCGRAVALRKGANSLRVSPTPQFQATRVVLRPKPAPVVAASLPAQPQVRSRSDSSRTVVLPKLGSSSERLLWIAENANKGWVATVGGKELKTVSINGWQQGWRVPAGVSGVVRLSFDPEGAYRFVLVSGLIVAAAVMLAAVVLIFWPTRRRRRDRTRLGVAEPVERPGFGVRMVLVTAVVAGLLGGIFLAAGILCGRMMRGFAAASAVGVVAVAGAATAFGDLSAYQTAGQVLTSFAIGLFGGALLDAPGRLSARLRHSGAGV